MQHGFPERREEKGVRTESQVLGTESNSILWKDRITSFSSGEKLLLLLLLLLFSPQEDKGDERHGYLFRCQRTSIRIIWRAGNHEAISRTANIQLSLNDSL